MIKLSNDELLELSSKKFCVFDDHAINVLDLPDADPILKKYLAYNPVHTTQLFKELGIEKEKSFFYSQDRELIETDRSGFRGYDKIYTRYFQNVRDKNLDILEIGIEYGYGLLAWSRYFENSRIYGIEKNPSVKFIDDYNYIKTNFPENANRIHFENNANSTIINVWNNLYENQKFDIIIDDGSHNIIHQIKTAKIALNYLKDTGMYFVEDIKLEIDSQSSINKIFDTFNEIAKNHNKKMTIYSHVNPYRVEMNRMNYHEKIFHLFNHHKTKNVPADETIKNVKRKIDNDNGNHYNYMISFY